MHRLVTLLAALLLTTAAAVAQGASAGRREGELSFGVTDGRNLITRDVGDGLLLRVVKERSATQEHFGWRIEVVRKPYRASSRNLLYNSRRTLGAHPSQVYAWHVTSNHFPNRRELVVRDRPVVVTVELIAPTAAGDGPDGRFVSGEVKIVWGRTRGRRRGK